MLALPLAGIDAFLLDEGMGKSAGLLLSLMWLRSQLQRNGGRLFA